MGLEIRDELEINEGDEKIVIKIWRNAKKSYERYNEKKTLINKCRLYKSKLCYHIILKWINGITLPLQTKIGKGMRIVHCNGIVIHGKCLIGNNLTIFQQVTIGVIEKDVGGGKKAP